MELYLHNFTCLYNLNRGSFTSRLISLQLLDKLSTINEHCVTFITLCECSALRVLHYNVLTKVPRQNSEIVRKVLFISCYWVGRPCLATTTKLKGSAPPPHPPLHNTVMLPSQWISTAGPRSYRWLMPSAASFGRARYAQTRQRTLKL